MRRILAAAVAAALSVTGVFASPASAVTLPWVIQAGSASFGPGGVLGGGNRFYPEAIAIHQGESVEFRPIGPHTVTFNRPAAPVFALFGPFGNPNLTSPTQPVNSGIIGEAPGAKFTLTFNLSPGSYLVICGLHIGMTETIDVVPARQELPKTRDEVVAQAQREVTRDLNTLAEIAAETSEENDEDEDGSPTVSVGAGNKRVSNLRFFPAVTTIHVGQSVTFLKTHDPTEPHTVTFGPESPDPVVQLLAAGGNTYHGVAGETVNSGFMSTKAQFAFYQLAGTGLPVAVTKFKVTFTAVNTSGWDYICALHDDIGMRGKVIVLP